MKKVEENLQVEDNNSCPKDGSCCGGKCIDSKGFCCQQDEENYDFDTCNKCDCICGGCICKNQSKATFWESKTFVYVSGIISGLLLAILICVIMMLMNKNYYHKSMIKSDRGMMIEYRNNF